MELFACDCLNFVLAHSDNLSQLADVIHDIVTKQLQINVAFTHLHFESPCLAFVYTSFIFASYQSYAAVFAESTLFMIAQFEQASVPPGSLSEASSSVFCNSHICTIGVLHFWYIWFCHVACFTYLHYCLHLYLFSAVLFCCSVFWGQ